MYNRYYDIKKFITDPEKLQIVNGSEVYISSEEDFDIVVDLKGHKEEFDIHNDNNDCFDITPAALSDCNCFVFAVRDGVAA